MNWTKLRKNKHQDPGAEDLQQAVSGAQLKEYISCIPLAEESVRSEQSLTSLVASSTCTAPHQCFGTSWKGNKTRIQRANNEN